MKFTNFLRTLGVEALPFASTIQKNLPEIADNISKTLADQSDVSLMHQLMKKTEHYSFGTEGQLSHVRFGSLKMDHFNNLLRQGNVEKAFKNSINKDLNAAEAALLKNEVLALPHAKIYKFDERVTKFKKAPVKSEFDAAKNADDLDKIINSNPKLKKFFDEHLNSQRTSVGTLAKTAVIAGIAITAGALIVQHQKSMSKCLRYEFNESTNTTSICTIQSLTCNSVVTDNLCSRDTLTADGLDESLLASTACQGITTPCRSCDTKNGDPVITNPLVSYNCVHASFFDALLDIVGDAAEKVMDTGSSIVGKTSQNLFSFLWKPLLFLAGVILALFVGYRFLMKPLSSPPPQPQPQKLRGTPNLVQTPEGRRLEPGPEI